MMKGVQWTSKDGTYVRVPTMKSLDSDKKASKSSEGDAAEAANDNNGFFTANEKIDFSNVKVEPLFEEAVNNLKDSEDEELHLLMVDNHIPAGAKLY